MREAIFQSHIWRAARFVLSTMVALGCGLLPCDLSAAPPTISYVQGNYATPNKAQISVNVTFAASQIAGDLNVVVVGWSDSTAVVTSVRDSRGNAYILAVGPTVQSGVASQSIYYSRNIVAAPAGTNTVTVTFSRAANSPDIRILEYSGADKINPVDVTSASTGNGSVTNSGSATTTSASDLIFGANLAQAKTAGPGSGFTQRLLTAPDGNIAEDRMVTVTGSYSATAPLRQSARWIMQMVAFRLGPDFTITAAPASLTIVQGSQGNSTIATSIGGGFNSSITLSASGMPSGTTVSFNPSTISAPGSGSSTMTITVGLNTPTGTYPITVTGNGGGIQHNVTVTLTVTAAPNFVLSASPLSVTIVQGNQGTSTITSTISGGFNSSISLSASGMPSGTTVSLNPSTIPAPGSGSSTMTITVGLNTPAGTYPLTITGNGGGIQQNTAVTLIVTPQVPTAPGNVAASPGGPGPVIAGVQTYLNGAYLTIHTTAPFDSTNGDLILLCASSHFGVTFTPSDNFGNTWVSVSGPTTTDVGFDLRTQIWYAPHPIVGSGQTVTMTMSQGLPLVMSVIVVKGSNTSSPLDAVSLIASDNGTQSVNVNTPNVNTTNANDLLAAWVKVSAGAIFQSGSGFTQQTGASSAFLDAETGPAAAPGIYSASFTLDRPQTWESALVSVANNPNQTTVTWTASTEDGGTIAGYLVERCQGVGCANFTQIGTTTDTAYNDAGLTASTSYSYRVRAQDTAGNLGPYSAVATMLTPAPIPSLPGNLTASSPSNTEIDLAWVASTETNGAISNYSVERCQGINCTGFAQIGTTTGTTYNDTALTPGSSCSYRVRAIDVAGNLGPYSNVVSATAQNPDNQPPTAPGNLIATGMSPSQINLSWTASSDNVGVSEYLIERCPGTGCTNFFRVNTSTVPSYSDTGLQPATAYTYRVQATDAAGNLSPYSNTSTGATQSSGSTNFALSVSPTAVGVMPGNQETFTITSTISGGFNSAVSLSASGMPAGITVSFNPSTIPAPGAGTSSMTVTVDASTTVGSYPITVTGNGGGNQQTANITLTVANNVQNLQLTADFDDVYYDPLNLAGGGTWNVSGATNFNHNSFAGSWDGVIDAFSSGVRYNSVPIPQGTQIASAILSIYGGTMPVMNGPSLIRIYGEAADSAPAWADQPGGRPDSIPYTNAYVDFIGSDPNWAGAWHQVDITAILQEIVSRAGWVSGNAIALALTGVDNRNYYLPLADSSQGAGVGPTLNISMN